MNGETIQLLLIGGIFLVGYFFFIRPQTQKSKEEEKYTEEVGKGDLIVTKSGLYGRVVNAKENTLDIDIAKNTVITIHKTAISKELSDARNQKDEKS